jgi:formate-dependent nitrite reductase membrane component NrfD
MDPKVNGQLQKEWGWLIAVYLFLGGVGSGAYTIAAIHSLAGGAQELSTTVGLWLGFPALLVGSLFLVADLGSPTRAVLAGLRPGSSWMARGFWIISIFMVLSFAHLVLREVMGVGSGGEGAAAMAVLAVAGIVFAVLTMAYTGILLGASKGIPFWRSGVVPVVFVVSAVVTGHFAIMLGMVPLIAGPEAVAELQLMGLEAALLVALEILVILFFLQAAYKLPDARESAERILRQRSFVVGYFVLGLATPLVLMLWLYLAADASAGNALPAVAGVGAVLGLAGGLILRQAVLKCGTLPTLNMSGFKFRRIPRPKLTKPGVGLLPPH